MSCSSKKFSCMWLFVAIVLLLGDKCICERSPRLVGIFDPPDVDMEVAFNYAIEMANNEVLTPIEATNLRAAHLRNPAESNFRVSQKFCKLLKSGGVAGIIGPQSPASAVHIQSVCDAKEVPHIDIRYDPVHTSTSINLYPDASALGTAYYDIIQAYGWKSFTILFESAPYLVKMDKILRMYDPKGHTITVRQLDLGLSDNYRAILRRVKLSEELHIIAHCSVEMLPELLKQAQQVGLMSDDHYWFITNLDLHTVDLEPFMYGGTNITGIRLFDPEDARLQQITNFWKEQEEEKGKELSERLQPSTLATGVALMFDSVLLYAHAFSELHESRNFGSIDCEEEDGAHGHGGYSFLNIMKTLQVRGLTRDINFDHKGKRTDFQLDIIELGSSGLHKVNEWTSNLGVTSARQKPPMSSLEEEGSLRNRSFRVLTALSPPYGMLKESADKLSGNDRLEGFGIDLIHELSLMLGFNYTFELQHDGVYGSPVNGQWNGMIRELLDNRADLAITDLTITAEREGAVDFTMPFMNLGISILYRKPQKEPPSLFSFMSPFSQEVWILLGMAYVGVSICLFILGRISPGEWDNPYPCIEEPDFLETQFCFRNAMWFSIGALMQQGTELAPKTPSTRAVVSVWWFFCLIMVSSYTANLAAFLVVESVQPTIKNAEDLASRDGKIKYGAKRGGSTAGFFLSAEYETYKKMGEFMKANPELLTSSNPEGLHRVKTEDYAFLMESTSIEYTVERECDVTQVGGLLDDKGYGIAMRKNSQYRHHLSEGVLRLQEQGKLTAMKIKWWKEKRGGGACSAATDEGGAVALELANVGGVFLLLVMGLFIALLMNFIQFLFIVKKQANDNNVRFRDEFREEFRFVCKWTEMTKELRHRKPSSVSGHSSTKHSNSAVHTIAPDTPKRESEKSENPDGPLPPPHVNTA